jgi:hypothetical protein
MPKRTALPLLGHASVATAEVTDGRACWPGPAGMARVEDRHQLLGPPGRMPLAGFKDRRPHIVRGVAGQRAGPTGARFKALGAMDASAINPGVPGLTADARPRATFGHGETVTQSIGDEGCVLVHRRWVTPRQGATSFEGAHEYRHSVTEVSGQHCDRCLRTVPRRHLITHCTGRLTAPVSGGVGRE